jgi:hypothetical protein
VVAVFALEQLEQEGEGLAVEFKERFTVQIDQDIVALHERRDDQRRIISTGDQTQ